MATNSVRANGPSGASRGGRDTHTCPSPIPGDAGLSTVAECGEAASPIMSPVMDAPALPVKVPSDTDINCPPGQPAAADGPCMKNSAAIEAQARRPRITTGLRTPTSSNPRTGYRCAQFTPTLVNRDPDQILADVVGSCLNPWAAAGPGGRHAPPRDCLLSDLVVSMVGVV
jgi:hypothetical protein